MALEQKDKPDIDDINPDNPEWYDRTIKDIQNLPETEEPEQKSIAEQEAMSSPSDAQNSEMNRSERDMSSDENDTLGAGYKGSSKVNGMTQKKKRMIAGGGILGIIVSFAAFIVTGSSVYLINLKENLTGSANPSSGVISRSLQTRRTNTTFALMKKGVQNLQTSKIEPKFLKAGFEIQKSGGRITKIARDGITIDLDGSTKNLTRQVIDLQNTPSGRAFVRAFDNVTSESVARFSGIVTKRKVIQRLGIYALIDWIGARRLAVEADADGGNSSILPDNLDRAPPDNPRAQLADAYRNADDTEAAVINSLDPEDARRILDVDETDEFADDTLNIGDDLQRQADEFKDTAKNSGGENLVIGAEDDIGKIADSADELGEAFLSGGEDTIKITEYAQKVGGTFAKNIGTKSLEILAAGFDLTSVPREGCRVAGTLEFIKSVRNVLMAAELAKFAVRFYTIADHQKAGAVEESSVKLMSLYLAGATGSTGMQSLLTGAKVGVSTSGISKYGIGYADVGVLSAISTFIRAVPGLDAANCKILNNPVTQIAGTLVGGVVAVFSGGASAGISLTYSIGLTLANEVAFAVATPLIIRAVANEVVTWYEESEDAGNILAASAGSFGSVAASANGGLPTTKSNYSKQVGALAEDRQENFASKSFFERYLSFDESESLISLASLNTPQTLSAASSQIQSLGFVNNGVSNLLASTLGSLFGNTTYAFSDQCQDTAAIEYEIATDAFCNLIPSTVPVLDLDTTEEILKREGYIDGTGQPIDEFEDFVENCFSGRFGVLHPVEVSKDGETDSNDPTCVIGVEDSVIPGDGEEYFGNGVSRVPTKKERFAAWYGYLVDTQTIIADVNDQLVDIDEGGTESVNNGVFVLGDSLTVGMQNLAGTDSPNNNYLERTLASTGWNPQIDAQGCRAVYQTIGAINGDGVSCPAETIIDGISAVSSPSNANYVKNSGTFVIGLGTNRYETDSTGQVSNDLFRQKAEELIDLIRSYNPAATIYWTNLAFSSSSETETQRNQIINQLVIDKNIRLMDWRSHLNSVNSNADVSDDVRFATFADGSLDRVHHDSDGYKKKADWVISQLGTAPSSSSGSVGVPSGTAAQVGSYKNSNIQRDSATTCPGIEQPGAKAIQLFVNNTWGGGTGWITVCRDVSTGSGAKSIHSEGRAVDSFFDATSPSGLQAGNETFGWLLANAENIGIQYIKFWRVQWSPSRGISCVTSRSDQSVHSNHIHYELNWSGALEQTPYFTSGTVINNPVNIDQEICRLL